MRTLSRRRVEHAPVDEVVELVERHIAVPVQVRFAGLEARTQRRREHEPIPAPST